MKFKQFMQDDDAVSPVIGVILMVAITVILAAVIASFVLGLGDQAAESQPTATFSFDYDGADEVTITHDGGDSIDLDRLSVVYDGTSYSDSSWDDNGDGDITAGENLAFGDTGAVGPTLSSGEEIRITWQSTDTDSSQTLATYEVP